MSYGDIEISNELGSPMFLYEFSLESKVWRYTSCAEDVAANGELYKAIYIEDDGVRQTGEAQTDSFKITMSFFEDVPRLFKVVPPSRQMIVKRLVRHEYDPQVVVNYVGFVTQVNASEPGKAEIECLTLSPTMHRDGLRMAWQRSCPYSLYSNSACRLRKENFSTSVTIEKASGGVLEASGFAEKSDGWFDGGIVEWIDSETGATDMRPIESHNGNTVTLLGKTDGIPIGQIMKAYPGCDKTIDTCDKKFSNVDNYGGYPHMPGKSPFSGNPLY